MLIDINKFIRDYNELVTSKKYFEIPEDNVVAMFKRLMKRTINLHETDNYNLNFIMITDFIRNNTHLLNLKPLTVKKREAPRELAKLKQYHPTSSDDVIGPYRVINTIGEGQFGKVFLVTPLMPKEEYKLQLKKANKNGKNGKNKDTKSKENEQLYALKRISLKDSQSTPSKIKKEIELLKQLSNIEPQITPKFITAFIQNGFVNIVQEYINCGTLSSYTKKHKLTPKMKAQLRDLISAIHELNIFHKDLHPENILVKCNPEPQFIISDFGEAKSLKNVKNDDYRFIQDIKDSDNSIDERVAKISSESMLFDLIIDELLRSKYSPKLINSPV